MKYFLSMALITLCLAAVPAGGGLAENKPAQQPLRYFMQQDRGPVSNVPYGNNPGCGSFVNVGDARIYYEVYKSGDKNSTPVFVFHGGGVGTLAEMGQMIDGLRKNHTVIAVSTRGHGRSEIGHKPLSMELKANDMIAVMRNVTNKPAILLGFSDGAYTAYKVASMYPEAVDRVVAIGAGSLEKGFFAGELKVSDLEKIDPAFVEQQKKIMPEPERWQEFCTDYMNFWNQMEAGKEFFTAIQCPVLLIAGDEDDHAPLVTMVAARQMIPNSRLCIVPQAWHTAFLDNYAVVREAVNSFISADTAVLRPAKKVDYNNSVLKN